MKSLIVSKKSKKVEGIMAQEDDYSVLLDEDCVVKRDDGSLLCILLKGALSKKNVVSAWTAVSKDDFYTYNRGTASGADVIVRNKTMAVRPIDEVQSGIVGYFERTPRFPYCRACSWNQSNPEKMDLLIPLVEEVDALMKSHAPERYEKQALAAYQTHRDFMIGKSNFSTLTINKNFRTAYHKDKGNLKDGISAMAVIRQGKWKGANLCFPEYEVAVKLDSLDLIIFDPHEYHGNTELYKLTPDAVRCSIVFYFREKMTQCLSAEDELKKVQNRQQGENLFKTIVRKNK